MTLLRSELAAFLAGISDGSFFQRMSVPAKYRRIRDIAISGNGEATMVAEFPEVVRIIGEERMAAGLDDSVKTVLITNSSLIQRSHVQAGLQCMSQMNGEIWFKIDTAIANERQFINSCTISETRILTNLQRSASLCSTWIQTCVFALDGRPAANYDAYLDLIRKIVDGGQQVSGVMLYGPARPSMQAHSARVSRVPEQLLRELAIKINNIGLPVRVSV
ncbi:MAG: radical SAM protein [Gammaproteobacteria bacterium]